MKEGHSSSAVAAAASAPVATATTTSESSTPVIASTVIDGETNMTMVARRGSRRGRRGRGKGRVGVFSVFVFVIGGGCHLTTGRS